MISITEQRIKSRLADFSFCVTSFLYKKGELNLKAQLSLHHYSQAD